MPYVKPGVYITQKYVSGSVGRGEFLVPVIIGTGLNIKRVWSEQVVRGLYTQTLQVDPTTRRASLDYPSTQSLEWSRLYRDGADLGNQSFSYVDASTVEIKEDYWIPGRVYKFQYLTTQKTFDTPANSVIRLLWVSATPDGSKQYKPGVDYQFDAQTGQIKWDLLKPAQIVGVNAAPFDLTTKNTIKLSVDGRQAIEITITGVNQSAVTAEEVVDAINTALANSPYYGSAYNGVASVVQQGGSNYIKLSSVIEGQSGIVNLYAVSNDASSVIFGVSAPYYAVGVGVRPDFGQVYYISYSTQRPESEYEQVKLYYGYVDALKDLGPLNVQNDLLIAVKAAFDNGAPLVGVIQVKDMDGDGVYTVMDWRRAIDVVKSVSYITDVVLLSTNSEVQSYLVGVVEEEASQLRNHWMGAWFGVSYGTTDNQAIQTAAMLQVPADSQGRGRYVLVTTPVVGGVKYTLTDTDTRTDVMLNLDTTFLAAAVVGRLCSLSPISDTLLRKQIIGFEVGYISDNEVSASRLASNGVFAVINKNGRLVVFDPVTTDLGGDEIFSDPSVRIQKDYLAYRIRKRLDDYLIGIVPDNPEDFVYELKYHIAAEIEAAIFDRIIGQYTDEAGLVRPIDLFRDVQVMRDPTSKSTYRFMYWFNARYGIKRIFGEYVVDVPLA